MAPGKVHDQLVGPPVELSVKLTGEPTQVVVVLAVKAATGTVHTCTTIVICAVSVQFPLPVPVTVYVVVTPGVTFTDGPVRLPGIQL